MTGMLVFAGMIGPAKAQGDIFTVRAVPVDKTAETAAAARQAAITAGHRLAFERLVDRLVPAAQKGKVPVLGPGLLEFYVLDFSVENERTSAVRYLAELTFRFNPEEVRALLRSSAVGFAEARSKPLLVLPVFEADGQVPRLWLEPNPWRAAWSQRPVNGGLVPLQVPLGDLTDVAAIDAPGALAGDTAGLSAIGNAYGAGAVMVTQATLSGDPLTGGAKLAIVSSRYEQGRRVATTRESIAQQADETERALFARAARLVDAAVQETWKQQNVLQFGNRRAIAVFVPLRGLSDWLEVRKRIDGIASIQEIGVTTLSRREAEVQITFVGDEQRLTRALAQRDLFLSLRDDSNWELTLPGAAGGVTEGAPRGGVAPLTPAPSPAVPPNPAPATPTPSTPSPQ
ncbi:DUF2066 domain-containing protein [Pelagibius litoralis]|uniref:DUF2066 domain-containing protein n=1 Tax=Pelagibius litoralis TaxID=374515 RepID=A0A967EZJ5_9PROT|nr:DUF2066 domain-containing protein [Pelagibius litoralis]NIA70280.1 DUF2066 domain-containing protein [Pelagibius litoralis]